MRPTTIMWVLLAVTLLKVTPVEGGTFSVAWDPVDSPRVATYRVYWGTNPGAYDQYRDVGRDTAVTLSGLEDCTVYHVAVKARDAAGNQSASFLNELSGFPRPRVATVTPGILKPGLDVDVVIRGANFMSGATVRFGNPDITVNSVTVRSCFEIGASIRIQGASVVGTTTVSVTNPDLTVGASTATFTLDAALAP